MEYAFMVCYKHAVTKDSTVFPLFFVVLHPKSWSRQKWLPLVIRHCGELYHYNAEILPTLFFCVSDYFHCPQ